MQAYIAGSVLSAKAWPSSDCFVILFSGDNFKVPYSFNSGFLDFREEFLKDVKDLKKEIREMNPKYVLFTGGEPCMQRQALLDIARFTKKNNISVGLETNGSKPDCLKSLLKENLVDYIALDIKSPLDKDVFEKTTKSGTFFITTKQIIDDVRQSISLLNEYSDKVNVEIRTTIVPGLIYKKEDILKIASVIKELECRWILQQFRPKESVLDKRFRNVNSPTARFLENLKKSCQKKFPNLRIDVFIGERDYYTFPEKSE